ncbi:MULTISPECIES: TlpA disulfide reductase family protein [unclassified Sphingobacterium]|uniref:TlpA disulfide reductase family protein n=1 Tax=unclassified Sphingobacterium TaxID=2609468 RepID=UPI0025F8DC91|nr:MULTISPECIES: TlpA disulfide reductase family protein [unclassified Sphingobacterium]
MRKLIITILISLTACYASAQESFSIQGKLAGNYEGYKVFLRYSNPNGLKEFIVDSTYVKDGNFILKGTLASDMVSAKLHMTAVGKELDPLDWKNYHKLDQQEFMLQNADFHVTGPNIKQARITGGPVQTDYLVLSDIVKPLKNKALAISKQMMENAAAGNREANKDLGPKYSNAAKAVEDAELKFLDANPNSFASLIVVNDQMGVENPKFEERFNKLSPRVRSLSLAKTLQTQLNAQKTVAIGNHAIDFVMDDDSGKPVSLSSFKGKYVLLDFWASWCGPCRAEMPFLNEIYQKYKDKNFEVVAVSIDSKKEHWLKAIKEDKMSWVQLSDLKGYKNDAALKYGVSAIPRNFLINPEGIVIAQDLRGEDIEKELSKIIK